MVAQFISEHLRQGADLMTNDSRDIIVVDIETSSLEPNAVVLEVAAINLETGEWLYFAPHVDQAWVSWADPAALQVNRYFERGVWRNKLSPRETMVAYRDLENLLRGNTLAGSNPAFDAQRLPIKSVWHHRLLDLSAYAAGVLGLPLNELPGLHKVCELLDIENEEEHSALSDARATAKCFKKLMERAK